MDANRRIREAADSVESLNRILAVKPDASGLYSVKRLVSQFRMGKWVWKSVGFFDEGLTWAQLEEKYNGLPYAKVGEACNGLTLSLIDGILTDGPDYRPLEMIPEDYYAL